MAGNRGLLLLLALAATAPAEASPRLCGVHFNPVSPSPPGTGHWLLDYHLIRPRIRAELGELVDRTGANFADVMVLIPYTLREKATPPTDGARDITQWAKLGCLDNLTTFLNDCHRVGISAEIDLATNMWIPYRVDTASHIAQSEWWPEPDETPWTESAVWYTQIIRYVEARVESLDSIAFWTMMGNYHFGGAEPVTWDYPEQPEIGPFTERFVKETWPRFRRAARRPVGSPIMLPIFADTPYWNAKTPADRLSSFANVKRWLVDDLHMPPDYWVMSTYPCCDPAPDGFHYLKEIVRILGPESAGRIISTDFKGPGHRLGECILDKSGLSEPEQLRWHFDKVAEYGLAGWWIWSYQHTSGEPTGLRDLEGHWLPDRVAAMRAGTP